MKSELIRTITIETTNEKEKDALGDYIYQQLVGKKDWILGYIGLNVDEPCVVKVYIYKGCKAIPHISI